MAIAPLVQLGSETINTTQNKKLSAVRTAAEIIAPETSPTMPTLD